MNAVRCFHRVFNLLILILSAGLASLESTAEAHTNAVPETLELGAGVRLELVSLRAGSFLQGSPVTEKDRGTDETQRLVRITEDFSLGKHPVTRQQFERFVQETAYRTEAEKGTSGGFGWNGQELQQQRRFHWRDPGFPQTGEHPVTLVTWNDAQEFNRWLSRRTGLTVQLPTEALWEYAARANTAYPYPGSDDPEAVSWHRGNAGNTTHSVGLKLPNAWGLLDMGGSVAEWCRDWYGPYSPNPLDDPEATQTPVGDKPRKVLRGGSWLRDPRNCRVAARWRSDPGSRNADIGFRIMVKPASVAQSSLPSTPINPQPIPEPQPAEPLQTRNQPGIPDPEESPLASANKALLEIESTQTVTQPEESFGFDFIGFEFPVTLLVLLVIGAVLVTSVVIFSLEKRTNPQQQRPIPNPGFKRSAPPVLRGQFAGVQIMDDGFWLPHDAGPIGAQLEYSYLLEGRRFTDRVIFEPNSRGQFIYTGSRPSDVTFMAGAPQSDEFLPNQTIITEPYSESTASTAEDIRQVIAGVGGAAIGWDATRTRTHQQNTPRYRNPAAY